MLLDAIKRDLLGGPATDLQAGWTRGDALRRRSAIVRTNLVKRLERDGRNFLSIFRSSSKWLSYRIHPAFERRI